MVYLAYQHYFGQHLFRRTIMTKTENRYEVRLHHRNNTEEFVFSSDDIVEATGHAKDCRQFNPDGSLLVYDLKENRIVETF